MQLVHKVLLSLVIAPAGKDVDALDDIIPCQISSRYRVTGKLLVPCIQHRPSIG